jgi:hypothetical protein
MRDRCVAMKQHCVDRNIAPSDLVRSERIEDKDKKHRRYAFARGDDDALQELLNKVIRRYDIVNGRKRSSGVVEDKKKPAKKPTTRRTSPKQVPTAAARKLATVALKAKAAEALREARVVIGWWCKELGEITGRKVVNNRKHATPGDLFLIDNLDKSKYLSVYAELVGGRRSGVTMIIPQLRTGKLNFQLAVKPEDFSAPHRKRLEPQDEDGRFSSRVSDLDKEGAYIVAEAIRDFIDSGTIESSPTSR